MTHNPLLSVLLVTENDFSGAIILGCSCASRLVHENGMAMGFSCKFSNHAGWNSGLETYPMSHRCLILPIFEFL